MQNRFILDGNDNFVPDCVGLKIIFFPGKFNHTRLYFGLKSGLNPDGLTKN